jgi:deazaflavin-dependent oxidoreductase (nitroreductase family)
VTDDPRLGRRVAHFNRRFTNQLTRTLAGRLPGFGVVLHTGRRSGRRYETPVNVFKDRDGYVIALTYGADADWVKNVLASGTCELVTRGSRHQLRSAGIVRDESRGAVPWFVRGVLRLLRVSDFLYLERPEGALRKR